MPQTVFLRRILILDAVASGATRLLMFAFAAIVAWLGLRSMCFG